MTIIDVARSISEEYLRKNGRWRDAASLIVSYYKSEEDMAKDKLVRFDIPSCFFSIGSKECWIELADSCHVSRVAILPSTPTDCILGCLENAVGMARENTKEKRRHQKRRKEGRA